MAGRREPRFVDRGVNVMLLDPPGVARGSRVSPARRRGPENVAPEREPDRPEALEWRACSLTVIHKEHAAGALRTGAGGMVGREVMSSKVSSAPGREVPVRRRNDAVPPSARLRVSRTERQAAPLGAFLQPRPAAAADGRPALYRGRARHSPNAFRSSVYGAAGRTVDTVRSGPALMRCRYGFGSRWHFSPAPDGGNGTVRHAAAQGSAAGGGTMIEHGARKTHTVGAARHGPGRQLQDPGSHSGATADPHRAPARAWLLSAAGGGSTRTTIAMKRATGRCDSWVRWPARKGRRAEIRARAAVRGDAIAAPLAGWTAGRPERAESYAKSVSCADLGQYGARPRDLVLLAIATVIASKVALKPCVRRREHGARKSVNDPD